MYKIGKITTPTVIQQCQSIFKFTPCHLQNLVGQNTQNDPKMVKIQRGDTWMKKLFFDYVLRNSMLIPKTYISMYFLTSAVII